MKKINQSSFLVAIVILCMLFFNSCKKNQEEFVGPKVGYASQGFSLVSDFKINKDSIYLSNEPLLFSATFNEKVSYTISITGSTSGAVKHLEGLSDNISLAWDGSPELVFFKTGEKCTAKLTVLGKAGDLGIRSFVINSTFKPKGLVIADMEPGSVGGRYAACGFWQPGSQIACGITNEVPPLEGRYAMVMEGKDVNGSQYIGQSASKPIFSLQGVDINTDHTKSEFTSIAYNIKTKNPDSLWFTIFIYGTGQKDAQLYIKFDQDDDSKSGNEPASENGFELQILDLSHYGWKAFSYNYSSINLGGNTSFGGNGDGVHRPDKIVQIEYALWSKRPNVPVRVVFDYPIFTVGKPFLQ